MSTGMAEILFVTWDGGGNVPPAVTIAEELRRRGHGVRFLGHRSQADTFAGTALPFEPFRSAAPFTSATPSSTAALLRVLGDQAMGRDVVSELASRPADVVVVDCLLFGVMRELQRAGRSYVVLEHSFDGYFRRAARGPLGIVLRLRGFRALDLIDAGQPVLAVTLPGLDTGHGDVVHTGPVVEGVPRESRADAAEILVLASLSTFAFRGLLPTWQRLLDAVDGLGVRVIATTGPGVDPQALRVPSNVELHRWLPHADVLPGVSLVLGHGGHATTMAALAHDVPLLVLPVDSKTDQPFIGRAVQHAGAGRWVSRRSSPARIRGAIADLLADRAYADAAARLGAQIRAMRGAANAADRIEAVVRNGAGAPGRPSARP
jgi:UDP:flavonoid glycosyltransferase YjiC (YdhE family)